MQIFQNKKCMKFHKTCEFKMMKNKSNVNINGNNHLLRFDYFKENKSNTVTH